jgi:hypothetical protein
MAFSRRHCRAFGPSTVMFLIVFPLAYPVHWQLARGGPHIHHAPMLRNRPSNIERLWPLRHLPSVHMPKVVSSCNNRENLIFRRFNLGNDQLLISGKRPYELPILSKCACLSSQQPKQPVSRPIFSALRSKHSSHSYYSKGTSKKRFSKKNVSFHVLLYFVSVTNDIPEEKKMYNMHAARLKRNTCG